MPRHIGWARVRRFALLGSESFDSYLHGIDSLSPQWNAQEIDGSVLGAWNTAVALGRDLVLDPGFDDPSHWVVNSADLPGTSWSIAAGVAHCTSVDADSGLETVANETTIESGKQFIVEFTISNASTFASLFIKTSTAASVNVLIPLASYVNGSYSIPFTASGTISPNPGITLFFQAKSAGSAFDLDNVHLYQTNILASSQYAAPGDNPLDGADTATEVGVATGIPAMPFARRFDGAAGYIALPSDYNSILDPATFSAFIFALPSWDANERDFFSHTIDADNYIRIGQSATAGTARWEIKSDGDLSSRTLATGAPDIFSLFGISSSGGVMKAIYNGEQVGADITLVGTVIGNFATMIIGARNDTPTNVLDGDAMQYDSANRELTPIEWLAINQRSGI